MSASNNSKRLKNWVKLGFDYLIASGLGQILGLAAGLIYVRYMPVEQYALYGLCFTALNFIILTTDMGLTSSVTYFWRYSRGKSYKFLPYFREIENLRSTLFWFCAPVAAITLITITFKRGIHLSEILLATLIIVITSWFAMYIAINKQVLRLRGKYKTTYFADLTGQTLRFLFALVVALGIFNTAVFGLAASAVAAAASWCIITRYTKTEHMNMGEEEPPSPKRSVIRYVLPMTPSFIVFSLQTFVLFIFVTIEGSKTTLAEVYALGRYMGILAIINTFISIVVVPRLSAVLDQKKFNRASFWVKVLLLICSFGLVAIFSLLPETVLLLIGSKYAHLTTGVVIVAITASFTLLNTFTVLTNRARGWVRFEYIVALGQVLSLVAAIYIFDLSETTDVMWAQCSIIASSLIMNTAINIYGIYRPKLVSV